MMEGAGEFFAVDKQSWAKVCALGMNAAIAYLVMARGTLRDHRTTAWSTHAIEERTNIARHRAKAAIQALIDAGLVRQDKAGSLPRYFLTREEGEPDWVWLSRRWVVERFFAWINRNRRLPKDFEATSDSARAFLYAASLMLLSRRLGKTT